MPRGERSEPKFESSRADQYEQKRADYPSLPSSFVRGKIRTSDRQWRAGSPSGARSACAAVRRRRMGVRSQCRGVSAANRSSNLLAPTKC